MPAILATNGFGGSKSDFEELAPAYARRGYAFLAYSGLGFGNSGCKITLDDPDWDGKAGNQLVSFLGGTKAAKDGTKIDFVEADGPGDPRVGMIGGSYGGQIQFAIAGIDRRLDTIVPQITWNDLSYSLGPNNTDFSVRRDLPHAGRHQARLAGAVLRARRGPGVPAGGAEPGPEPPRRLPELHRPGVPVAGDHAPSPATRTTRRSRCCATRRWPRTCRGSGSRRSSSRARATRSSTIQEAVATYKVAARAGHAGEDALALVGALRRRASTARATAPSLETAYESRLALQWFDHYLRGVQPKPALDFSFLRDWVELQGRRRAGGGRHAEVPGRGRRARVFLSGTNRLASARSRVAAGQRELRGHPRRRRRRAAALTRRPGARRARHLRVVRHRAAGQDHRRRRHPQADGSACRRRPSRSARARTRRASSSCSPSCSTSTPTATPRCRATSSPPCAWRT